MTNKRDPLKSKSKSIVVYPSAIFALEKIESYPFERFAYNALSRGIPALNQKGLNDNLWINFEEDEEFSINAFISQKLSPTGENIGYEISTNVYTPPILLVLCKHFGDIFSDFEYLTKVVSTPELFKTKIQDFGRDLFNTHNDYNKEGFAIWTRELLKKFNIKLSDVNQETLYFDLCSKFIVNHEVAHAYVGQLNLKYNLKDEDYRAFEYIVDLIAIEWLYGKWIGLTPDTKEYRDMRGFEDHKDSIYNNSVNGIQAIMIILLFFGIARALVDDGRVSLEAGRYHPNSFFRHTIQHVHFMTFLESNYGNLLGEDIKGLDDLHKIFLDISFKTGFINKMDMDELKESQSYIDFTRIPELVKLYNIKEFERFLPIIDAIKNDFLDQLK